MGDGIQNTRLFCSKTAIGIGGLAFDSVPGLVGHGQAHARYVCRRGVSFGANSERGVEGVIDRQAAWCFSRYAERDGVALGNEARGRNLDIDLEKLARRGAKISWISDNAGRIGQVSGADCDFTDQFVLVVVGNVEDA